MTEQSDRPPRTPEQNIAEGHTPSPYSKKEKRSMITVVMKPEIIATLERMAAANERNLSGQVRWILGQAAAQFEAENPAKHKPIDPSDEENVGDTIAGSDFECKLKEMAAAAGPRGRVFHTPEQAQRKT